MISPNFPPGPPLKVAPRAPLGVQNISTEKVGAISDLETSPNKNSNFKPRCPTSVKTKFQNRKKNPRLCAIYKKECDLY